MEVVGSLWLAVTTHHRIYHVLQYFASCILSTCVRFRMAFIAWQCDNDTFLERQLVRSDEQDPYFVPMERCREFPRRASCSCAAVQPAR